MFNQELPAAFHRRVIELSPGRPRPYDQTEWGDSIVFVERGQIELESTDGSRHPFTSGDLLCLHGLQLRALHTTGREPAVLVAVSRLNPRFTGKIEQF